MFFPSQFVAITGVTTEDYFREHFDTDPRALHGKTSFDLWPLAQAERFDVPVFRSKIRALLQEEGILEADTVETGAS